MFVGVLDGVSYVWLGLFEGKDIFDIVVMDFFVRDRVDDCRFDVEEGKRGGVGFGGSNISKRGDDVGVGFGLLVCLWLVVSERWFFVGLKVSDLCL